MSIYTTIKGAVQLRMSGEVSARIENLKMCISLMEQKKECLAIGKWAEAYSQCLRELLTFHQMKRFFPQPFLVSVYRKSRALDSLISDGKYQIKDIRLPLAVQGTHIYYVVAAVVDSLASYILEDLSEEDFLSVYPIADEGPYEYHQVRLEAGDIVIDAGANIGEFAAMAGVKGCKAYAFEPMPEIIETYLTKTAEWNPNITVCPYALFDKKDEISFHQGASFSGSTAVKDEKKVSVTAKCIDLDTFVEENKLSRVDFIKADIEGAERNLLMGAKRVLRDFAPKISICTYHLPDDPQVLRSLILEANPNYVIEERFRKMYAYVPKE